MAKAVSSNLASSINRVYLHTVEKRITNAMLKVELMVELVLEEPNGFIAGLSEKLNKDVWGCGIKMQNRLSSKIGL